MIIDKKKIPDDFSYDKVFFAWLPFKLKDERKVWLEKVWVRARVWYGPTGREHVMVQDSRPLSEYYPQ